jgi:membrane dipeptidase
MPGYVIERERADLIERDKEQERLKKLYPDDPKKVEAELSSWRKTYAEPQPAALADVANHIDHIRKVAGIDHVGIGSDFEGYHGACKGLEDVSCYPALLAELMRRGYSKDDLKKLAGLNVLRVLHEAEKVSARLQRETHTPSGQHSSSASN